MSASDEHPADRLIRELITAERAASSDEIVRIVERIATAPFTSRVVRVPTRERGVEYQGHVLAARMPSVDYHLIKRVAIEEQWEWGTTLARYLSDLERAVRDPSARLVVYERRGDHIAATITPTSQVIPADRLGIDSLPQIVVVYSADSGMIVTGYQFSTLDQLGIPGEAQWLR